MYSSLNAIYLIQSKALRPTSIVFNSSNKCLNCNVHFQALALPKLPVPPLERTLEKYEKTMQPLLNEASRERLKNLIQKFGGPNGLGPRLQLHLLQKQQKTDNWVTTF